MSEGVQFEEEDVLVDQASRVSRRSALTNAIMKTGVAKTEAQANYVLIGIMCFCLLATIFVISRYII